MDEGKDGSSSLVSIYHVLPDLSDRQNRRSVSLAEAAARGRKEAVVNVSRGFAEPSRAGKRKKGVEPRSARLSDGILFWKAPLPPVLGFTSYSS